MLDMLTVAIKMVPLFNNVSEIVYHPVIDVLQIADGTDVLETLIGPLLDLSGMENVSTL